MLADGGAGSVVRVQVRSLQDYAAQLEHQIDAMSGSSAHLNGRPGWGQFGQAYDLVDAHDQALLKMKDLLNQVLDGVVIAHDAARTIGSRYTHADEFHRTRLSEVTNALEEAAGVPAADGSALPRTG